MTYLNMTDKVHILFSAFYQHNVPYKRKMCDLLRELIDTKQISGNSEIKELLEKLYNNTIQSPDMEDTLYSIVATDEDSMDEQEEEEEELPIDNTVLINNTDRALNMMEIDRKEISYLCLSLLKQLKEVETSCLNGSYNKANYNIQKMNIFFEKYMGIMDYIVNSYKPKV